MINLDSLLKSRDITLLMKVRPDKAMVFQWSCMDVRVGPERKLSAEELLLSFEPAHCSLSSSNCCFLTCIQVSLELGEVVWYSHLFKSFPQFVMIHIVKALG